MQWVIGTYINDGWMHTKNMIASARTANRTRTAAQLGVEAGAVTGDQKKNKGRKEEIITSVRSEAKKRLEEGEGVELIFGEARFSGHKELTVKAANGSEQVLSADWIFINAGAEPVIPQIEGLQEIDYLTSTTILDLEAVPEHLAVIGGNYIGLELAQLFHRLGSKVTILEKSSRIAHREDEDVSAELAKILGNEGLEILTSTEIGGFEKVGGNIR